MGYQYDVFISYRSTDSIVAQSFAHAMENRNISCFLAHRDVIPGGYYADMISSAIRQAKLFVLLISEESMQSRWVLYEVGFALAKGIKIFPIHLDDSNIPNTLASQLSGTQIFKFTPNNPNDSITYITHTIKNLVKTESEDTKFPTSKKDKGQPIKTRPIAPGTDTIGELTGGAIAGAGAVAGATIGAAIGAAVRTSIVGVAAAILGSTASGISRYFKGEYTLKLFCDAEVESDMEVRVDGRCVAKIKYQDVIELKLNKGKYFINVCPTNKNLKNISFTHSFSKENNGEMKEIILPLKKTDPKNNNLVRYKCFIGGSTSLTSERNAVRATLSRLHNEWENESLIVSAYTFEDFSNAQNQQQRYFNFISRDATCAIFIIADGVGDHTIAEYRLAYKTFTKSGEIRPMPFVYADETVSNPEVDKFKCEVLNNGSYWRKYKDTNTLMSAVREDINAELFAIFKMGLKK